MKTRKVALGLALALAFSGMAGGCAKKTDGEAEKIKIEVGGWPGSDETSAAEKARYEEVKAMFETDFSNVEVVPVEGGFDQDTFLPMAASGQLPTLYHTYFTEVDRIVNAGFAADVTDYMKEFGYTKKLDRQILDLITREDRTYFVPKSAYLMGLYVNRSLFEQIGKVNEDGTLQIPQTYDELVETAQLIKEKTGNPGFAILTKGHGGGWHFLNIAWAFGTTFMEQDENGKWIAKFDSPEGVAALQFVKDLKWKYDVLPTSALVDSSEINRLYSSNQLGMFFGAPPMEALTREYKMSLDGISVGAIPEGPAGRYSQMGGGLVGITAHATDEQIRACFNWLSYIGWGSELTEDAKNSIDASYRAELDRGNMIGVVPYSIWNKDSDMEKFTEEKIAEYANVDMKFFKEYSEFDKVTVRPEEPVNCQELYQVLTNCLQEVLSNENADPAEVMKKAAKDFQTNSLDNAN